MNLHLDWCNHAAAKYAVEHWHYSRSLPTPPRVAVGAWENGKYIGCVLFSRGANNNLSKMFGLDQTEVCELTRVALGTHGSPVSQIVAVAIRLLRRHAPGLRLIVSYADPNEGHVGGIYQAGGWTYTGKSAPDFYAVDATGRRWHSRQVSKTGAKRQFGVVRSVPRLADCTLVPLVGKYRYVLPLDAAMRAQIAPLAKPYPKRASEPTSVGTDDQSGQGGATPTRTLQDD